MSTAVTADVRRSRVPAPQWVRFVICVCVFLSNSSQGLFTGAARSAKGGGDKRLENVYAKKEPSLLDTNNVIGKTADTSVQNYIEVNDKVRSSSYVLRFQRYDNRSVRYDSCYRNRLTTSIRRFALFRKSSTAVTVAS